MREGQGYIFWPLLPPPLVWGKIFWRRITKWTNFEGVTGEKGKRKKEKQGKKEERKLNKKGK